ncbi:MAG: hypothetical protein OXT65_10895 [Alphaproteobacteria bacterium]|nr:hypothetical protein [Alphaproteobacteria bacterium]
MAGKLKGLFTSDKQRQEFAARPRPLPDVSEGCKVVYSNGYMDKNGQCAAEFMYATSRVGSDKWDVGVLHYGDNQPLNSIGISKGMNFAVDTKDMLGRMAAYEARMEKKGRTVISQQPGNYASEGARHGYAVNGDAEVVYIHPCKPVTEKVVLDGQALSSLFGEKAGYLRFSCAKDVETFLSEHAKKCLPHSLLSAVDLRRAERRMWSISEARSYHSFYNTSLPIFARVYMEGAVYGSIFMSHESMRDPILECEAFVQALRFGRKFSRKVCADDNMDMYSLGVLRNLKDDYTFRGYARETLKLSEREITELLDVMVRDPDIMNIKTPLETAIALRDVIPYTRKPPAEPPKPTKGPQICSE